MNNLTILLNSNNVFENLFFGEILIIPIIFCLYFLSISILNNRIKIAKFELKNIEDKLNNNDIKLQEERKNIEKHREKIGILRNENNFLDSQIQKFMDQKQ